MRRRIRCDIYNTHRATQQNHQHIFVILVINRHFFNTFDASIQHYFFILLILLLGHTIIGAHHIRH